MAKKAKYIGIVVPETHWDRAWYFPFQGFRVKLVKMFNDLLRILRENKDYKNFTFDGQTVILEDFLEVHPEKKEEIKSLVKAGRLSVGPWYILPDEFLVSGEALIRNLEIGHDIARGYGRTMKAGYIPDPFGHISQLPAIMDGFGLNSVIFMRGAGRWIKRTGPIFKWYASDKKTWVHGIEQFRGYFNLLGWGGNVFNGLNVDLKKSLEQVEKNITDWEKTGTRHKTILFNNGIDHYAAQEAVPMMIKHVNKNCPRINLINSDYEDYVKRVIKENVKLLSYRGEMHDGYKWPVLSGTFSARMWIHQRNFEVQKFLEETVEPYLARLSVTGYKYDKALLTTAWKHLLKCHPHDDICGCSVDATHEDNKFNFKAAHEIGQFLVLDGLKYESDNLPRAKNAVRTVAVFNGSFYKPGKEITGVISLPEGTPDNKEMHLQTLSGRNIPCIIKPLRYKVNTIFKEQPLAKQFEVAFLDRNIAPESLELYAVKEGANTATYSDINTEGRTIENRYYSVKMNTDGSVNIKAKETGLVFGGVNYFEDTEDAGDEYDYSPLAGKNSKTFTSYGLKAKLSRPELTPWSASLTAEIALKIPGELQADRKARSKEFVTLKIKTTVRLLSNEKRIEFATVVDNNAKDHRIRAVFKTPVKTKTVEASQHFDVVKRPVDPVSGTEKYEQPAVPTQHMDDFVSVSDKKSGFTLISKGLPEYEARNKGGSVELCLTLLRCCGYLSNSDLITRKGHAGPYMATPGAQCPGTWSFEYAVVPHKEDWLASKAYLEAGKFAANSIFFEMKDTGKDARKNEELPLLSIDKSEAVITSLKNNKSGDSVELRFYNISGKTIEACIAPGFKAKEAFLTRLDGSLIKKLNVSGGTVTLPVLAKEIVTVLFKV